MDKLFATLRQIIPPEEAVRDIDPATTLEHTGRAILAQVRQVAEAAQRNEDRAKLQVQQLTNELSAAHERIEFLQRQLAEYADRGGRAEEWLLHIHDQIRDGLLPQFRADDAGAVIPLRRAARG